MGGGVQTPWTLPLDPPLKINVVLSFNITYQRLRSKSKMPHVMEYFFASYTFLFLQKEFFHIKLLGITVFFLKSGPPNT